MATLEVTTLDGTDDTILTALAPTLHVYQSLPALHARSGVLVDDRRRRLRRLEQAGYVHRLRTDAEDLEDAEDAEAHYCLSLAGRTHAAARSG
jgi:hypothetical protein